jgi:hypothetical protein
LSGYAQNVGSSNALGAELTLKGLTAVGLRWNIGYALISIRDHLTLPLTGPALLLDYKDGSPKNVVDGGLGYSTGPWELDLQGRWQSWFTDYAGSAFGATAVAIPNQFILNARVGYKVTERRETRQQAGSGYCGLS